MRSDDRDPPLRSALAAIGRILGFAAAPRIEGGDRRAPELGDEVGDEVGDGRGAAVPPFPVPPSLDALAPRSPAYISACYDEAQLEAYRRLVIATAMAAIAEQWDSGRLSLARPGELPYLSEVRGIAGQRSGLASEVRAQAEAARLAAVDGVADALAALGGRVSAFDALCDEHEVGAVGAIVLLFVAAPSLWSEVARLYGILVNDPARPLCDEALLHQLLRSTANRRDVALELDATSSLIRLGLVVTERGRRPFQALLPNPVVVAAMGGTSVDAVEPGVRLVTPTMDLGRFAAPAGVIDRALADLAAAPAGRGRLVVRGRTGSGRRTLLAILAHQAGRTLATIDTAPLISGGQISALRELLLRAHLRGWLPCMDGVDGARMDDALHRGAVREILRDHPGPLALRLAHDAPVPIEPGHVRIDLPVLSVGERAQQWSQAAASLDLAVVNSDDLAARFAVGAGTIRSVLTSVVRGGAGDLSSRIEAALRQHTETRFGALATRVTRLPTWAQVVLGTEVQDGVTELIARIRHRRTVYDTWGFDAVLTTARGVIALFQGPSGTGKTLVASALARELGLDLYRIDLSQVLSKWIGETEKNLAQVFDAVEEGQALLLFDEADALFGRRGNVIAAADRYGNAEVDYLLQRLDGFEGVAVLTTNLETAIDPAFHRRLTCRLTFPVPDERARARLWRVHLPDQLPRAGELDLAGLARRYPMTGGAIRNASLRAAFLAAEERAPLSQFHLERVVRAELRDSGKDADSG